MTANAVPYIPIRIRDQSVQSGMILIIEPDRIDQRILGSMISETHYGRNKVFVASSNEIAAEFIQKQGQEILVVLLNISPSGGKIEEEKLLSLCKNRIPLIALSSSSNAHLGIQAIQNGAQDHLVKGDFSSSVLEKTISYAVDRLILLNERLKTQKDLQEQMANERKRIAMEIHDGLGQVLIAAKYKVSALEGETVDESRIENITNILDRAIQEARKISTITEPTEIVESGFVTSILELCKQYENSTRIKFLRKTEEVVNILRPLDILNMYRIVQEGVNNAVKYAHPSVIKIETIISDDYVDLIVEDNGKGFDMEKVKRGSGVNNIQTRSELLKAELSFTSGREGTKIHLRIPRNIVED